VAPSVVAPQEKFNIWTSEAEAMASVFWGGEGSVWMEFLEKCATINSERYVESLKSLKQ
jgi:hypothetical protein